MMFRNSFLISALIFAVFTLSSCGNAHMDKAYAFDRAVKDYNHLLQGKDIDEASGLVDIALQERFFKEAQKLVDSVNISTIKIRKVVMSKDEDEATVTVVREVFDNQSYVLKKVTITQKWKKFGSGNGSWKLIEGDF